MAKEKPRKAWLAPLTVPLALRERLEHEWSRMNTAMGITLPKSHFVRMLLERGLDEVGQAVWAGSEGVTVRPSTPEEGVIAEYDERSRPGVRRARSSSKARQRKARKAG